MFDRTKANARRPTDLTIRDDWGPGGELSHVLGRPGVVITRQGGPSVER